MKYSRTFAVVLGTLLTASMVPEQTSGNSTGRDAGSAQYGQSSPGAQTGDTGNTGQTTTGTSGTKHKHHKGKKSSSNTTDSNAGTTNGTNGDTTQSGSTAPRN